MATTTAALPPRNRGARIQRNLQPYVYLVPAFVVMAIITFYPLVFQVWMSFHDFGQINFRVRNPVPAEFIGLDNYIRIAQSNLQIPNFEFVRLVLFNLWWAFSNVVVHIIIGVFVAVILNSAGLRFRGVYRALFILPVVIPQIIVATVWRNMFDQEYGAVNQGLQGVGGILGISADNPAFHLNWLRQPDDPISWLPLPLAFFGMLTANSWLGPQLGRRHRRAAVHPGGAVRGRRDGWSERVAEIQDRDDPVPAASDAAIRDLRFRDHVQPVLPAVLHDAG
jgi:arabinogalactan oligomer/maltooligosaccharide transport system permease protein